jgi:hypothetical protein
LFSSSRSPFWLGSAGGRTQLQWLALDQQFFDDAITNEMLLNDSLEILDGTPSIPRALGIYHRYRSALANSQTIRFGPAYASVLRET